MTSRRYHWRADGEDHEASIVYVPSTGETPFPFGGEAMRYPVSVAEFYMLTTPVTQALWRHVMGSNPSKRVDLRAPVENISWHAITTVDGFLDRINASALLDVLAAERPTWRFRLPSESEWEYAARGGPRWRDGFMFSGSNNPDAVAWVGPRWRPWRSKAARMLGARNGWRILGRRGFTFRGPTRTHAVATKAPNQLGLYDMSGNVWEWCQDVCSDDVRDVPANGHSYEGPGDERRLRGGCHNNWDLHCTVAWRYGITPDAHDGDIGFRVVLAP